MLASDRTPTPGRKVTAARTMRQQAATRRVLGGKRGYCSVGAVHGGEGNDPILAPQVDEALKQ